MSDRSDTNFRRRRFGPVGAAIAWASARRTVRDADSERPGVVHTDERSRAVLDCARRLASAGRDDDAAVAELRKAARGRQRTLDQALRASRFAGRHQEEQPANLVFRLIQAAHANSQVAPLAASDQERIQAVEAFVLMPPADQWDELARREPRLVEIKQAAQLGSFGRLSADPDGDRKLLVDAARASIALDQRLHHLLGPRSDQDDTLLRTEHALDAAHTYLVGQAPGG